MSIADFCQDVAPAFALRDYQEACVDGIRTALTDNRSTLAVLPTGCGKTVVFGHVAARWRRGRVLIMAHRDELIRQGANKTAQVTGEECDIEMGESYADRYSLMGGKAKVVVTSVQTMCRERRHQRFDPAEFGLLIIDEAHHATAESYRKVVEHFSQNPNLKVLGVTATPDRADEEALGKVFDSVAYEYGILDAISDGWLAPIEQQFVFCEGLDFSGCRTTLGDLNSADLADLMEQEAMLHRVVHPTIDIAGDRQTLVFAASVQHATRMAEIANRHSPGCAEIISGKTDIDLRRDILARYSRREFQFLFNCAIATEGFDEPSIGVVAIARPTKSRSLYAQMVGRGTRTLPGIVDRENCPEDRRSAISVSGKPNVLVLDFVGNSGRHKLINCADILGGNYEEKVVDRARAATAKKSRAGESVDVVAELEKAKAEEEEDKVRRQHVVAKAKYATQAVSPFDVVDVTPVREPGYFKGKPATSKQREALLRFGLDAKEVAAMSPPKASKLIGELIKRREQGLCSFKQAKLLRKFGYAPDATFAQAKAIIDGLAANNWRRSS